MRKCEWISIMDRLPDEKTRVLLYDKDGFGALSGRRIGEYWYLEGDKDVDAKISHWMPLPEPPETT